MHLLIVCQLCRSFSSKPSPNTSPPDVKPPSTLRAYIVRKYVEYITRFDATFERSYPKVYKVYRLFKDGNDYRHLMHVVLIHQFLTQLNNFYYVSMVVIFGCFKNCVIVLFI